MLLSLLILHIYWTYIIMKIAFKSVKGKIDDIREESDSEIFSAPSANVNTVMNNIEKSKKIE